MRGLLLLGLFGCDAVFGLPDRPVADAALDVAFPDDTMFDGAPAGCPTTAAPMFVGPPVILFPNCNSYTTSAPTNLGFLSCSGAFYESSLTANGMAGAFINVEPGQTLSDPRLAPSGEELFVTSTNAAGGGRSIRTYRQTGGRWNLLAVSGGLPTAFAGVTLFASTPSQMQLGSRRIIIHHTVLATPQFSEFVEEGGEWMPVHDYTADELDVMTFAYPSLSPDGLHLVFSGNPTGGGAGEVRYARRASLNDTFDTSAKLDIGFENALYPHLSADCSRLYFTGFSTVQYVHP